MPIIVKMNNRGLGQLLKSAEVQADLLRRARNIARKAGPGMEPSVRVGFTRARGSVITATPAARESEARDRTLTRALDAGRR